MSFCQVSIPSFKASTHPLRIQPFQSLFLAQEFGIDFYRPYGILTAIPKTTTSCLMADFNFTPGQTYYIVITAYTDTGEESNYSSEIKVGAPSAPTGLTVK